MKKFRISSIVLCAALLVQLIAQPAMALPAEVQTVPPETQLPDPGMSALTETVPAAVPSSLPFGSVCIEDGCRTIEGKSPLSGNKRLLDTAQAAFAFEVHTGTVVYSYNPDTRLDPGSLTKIVTALLAIELCDMEEVVTVNSQHFQAASRLSACGSETR